MGSVQVQDTVQISVQNSTTFTVKKKHTAWPKKSSLQKKGHTL